MTEKELGMTEKELGMTEEVGSEGPEGKGSG
jgi:hypothetical protein